MLCGRAWTGVLAVLLFLAPLAVRGAEDAASLLAMGQAALQDGFYEIARAKFEQYMEDAPTRRDKAIGRLWLARACIELGDYATAEELLTRRDRTVRGTPLQSEFYYWQAMAKYRAGSYAEAIAILGEIDAEDREWAPRVLRLRAHCQLKQGSFDRALESFQWYDTQFADESDAAVNLLEWASLLLEQEREQEAIPLLERLLVQAPESASGAKARLLLGELLTGRNQWAEAVAVLEPLIADDATNTPWRVDGLFIMADIHERQNNFTQALAAVEQALPSAVGDHARKARLFKARLMIQTGDVTNGLALLHTWVADFGDVPEAAAAQLEMAEWLLDQGQFNMAEKEFQNYLDVFSDDPGRARALLGKGWCLFEAKRFGEAATAFDKVSTLSNDADIRKQALMKKADALFAHENYEQSREAYLAVTRAFPGAPEAPQALFQAAESLARLGMIEESAKEFQAIEDAYPDSPFAEQAAIRLAILSESQGAWERALTIYNRVMRDYSDGLFFVRSLHGRALVQYRLGRFQEALDDFERVGERFPDSPLAEQAVYMQGWCLYLLGRNEEALALCRRFIKDYPQSPWAPDVLFWLAEYHYNHGMYAEAETQFLELAERYPGGVLADDALFWAGRAAVSRKEYLRAIEHFNKLTQEYGESPKIAETRFAQGDALSALGQFAGAILAFEEVIKKYPGSYLADLARGRKGDCQFTLGSEDPVRYEEAQVSYEGVLQNPQTTVDLRLQAEYKIGRCYEKRGRMDDALNQYLEVVYGYLADSEQQNAAAAVWFARAAFSAAAIKETQEQWREAIHIYQRIVEAGVPAAADAQQRIQRIRLEHWLLIE